MPAPATSSPDVPNVCALSLYLLGALSLARTFRSHHDFKPVVSGQPETLEYKMFFEDEVPFAPVHVSCRIPHHCRLFHPRPLPRDVCMPCSHENNFQGGKLSTWHDIPLFPPRKPGMYRCAGVDTCAAGCLTL